MMMAIMAYWRGVNLNCPQEGIAPMATYEGFVVYARESCLYWAASPGSAKENSAVTWPCVDIL